MIATKSVYEPKNFMMPFCLIWHMEVLIQRMHQISEQLFQEHYTYFIYLTHQQYSGCYAQVLII